MHLSALPFISAQLTKDGQHGLFPCFPLLTVVFFSYTLYTSFTHFARLHAAIVRLST